MWTRDAQSDGYQWSASLCEINTDHDAFESEQSEHTDTGWSDHDEVDERRASSSIRPS